MAINSSPEPHAIMIAYTLQGHIIPYVNLALKLASQYGFSITFVNLEFVHHSISKSQENTNDTDIFAKARRKGLDISYTTISDGFPVEFNRSSNLIQFLKSIMNDFPDKVDNFIKDIIRSRPGSNFFLISDAFYEWPEKISRKYNLVNVCFWTESVLVLSLYYHMELLKKNGHVPVNGQQENVDYVPGIKSISTKDFMSHYHDSEPNLINDSIFRALSKVASADFVMCNTIDELEKDAISALKQNQPVYAIGPIFPVEFGENPVPRSLIPESDCLEWLEKKPVGSVLYISFGSLAIADKNVILEMASGILLCEVNFIWVLRPGSVGSDSDDIYSILPEGFAKRTKDSGVIVPWCSQNKVLSTPAIGGFLTHCGWNSILESIWCGVPMLCYPLFTDQPTNRKLVVDDWKIGMNLCDGGDIRGEEVAEKIRSLISGERSDALKQEIENVKNLLQNAVAVGGSSHRNFDCFVHDVLADIDKRCEKFNLVREKVIQDS